MLSPTLAPAQRCASGFSMRDLKTLADTRSTNASASDVPLHPAVTQLATTIVKIFACQGMVNYYAEQMGLPDDIVREKPYEKLREGVYEMHFTNKAHAPLGKDVCGSIRFEVPLGLPGHDAKTNFESWWNRATRALKLAGASDAENDAYKAISKNTFEVIIQSTSDLYDQSDNLSSRFLPDGQDLPNPSTENLVRLVWVMQDRLSAQFTAVIQRNAWDEAKVAHFIEVARCHAILPVAKGPDEQVLAQYKPAFEGYVRFKTFLDGSMPP